MSKSYEAEKDALALASLEAYLESFSQGPDVALAKLRPIPGPASIERQLQILLRAERFEEATRLIGDEDPHQQWVVLGIEAAAVVGEKALGKKLIGYTDQSADVMLRIRSAIGWAEGTLKWIFRNRGNPQFILPGNVSESEVGLLEEALRNFGPLLGVVHARGKVENELESQGLQLLLTIYLLIDDRDRAKEIADLLFTRNPVPLKAVEAVIQGVISCDPMLPSRIRSEHPDELQAEIMACILEGRYLNNPKGAFHSAVKWKNRAVTDDQKETLVTLLYEMARKLNDQAFVQASLEIAKLLIGAESKILSLINADIDLYNGEYHRALEILKASESREDPIWLALYGNVLLKLHEDEKAQDVFMELAKISRDPAVFRELSQIAQRREDVSTREFALLELLKIRSDDPWTRQELGRHYAEVKKYNLAAEQYRWLVEKFPEEAGYAINLAVSLSFDGELDQSAEVLEQAVKNCNENLHLFVLLSEIYLSKGKASAAFECLDRIKEKYWDNPKFLTSYMNVAYASGKETEANFAFGRLRELSDEGQVEQTVMRAIPLDELKDLVRHDREQTSEWLKGEIDGKMPWTLTADLRNDVPYAAWMRKTQGLTAVYEEAVNWAELHIYATNGYRLLNSPESELELASIEAPAKEKIVVADVSSLITLHALGLLSVVAKHFLKIVIPADYLSRIINENKRLFPHQASQQNSAELIEALLFKKSINVFSPKEAAALPIVDEYNEAIADEREVFSLREVFDVMHRYGYINDADRERAEKLISRISLHQNDESGLLPHQKIIVKLGTLQTIATAGLLDSFVRCFAVYLSETDERENKNKVKFFSSLATIREKHSDMWIQIRSEPKFETRALKQEVKNRKNLKSLSPILSAVSLALEEDLPLLADDRVCQTVVANERKNDRCATFDSSALLLQLIESGGISVEKAADCFLNLMSWRYRFLIVPASILKVFASRFMIHPPGVNLLSVSNYLHDAMRDPGLLSRFEPTDPPTPIAVRYYREWVQTITEFIVDIWIDQKFSEEYAMEITKWAINEFLPAAPKVLSVEVQSGLGNLVERIVMTHAFIRSSNAKLEDVKRINKGLTTIAHYLGIEDRYLALLTEVVNAKGR